jgi:DNA-binding NarL/FixJ family response regulator
MDEPTSGQEHGALPAGAPSFVIDLPGRVVDRDATTARLRELATEAREIAADLDVVLRAIEVACAVAGGATVTPVADIPPMTRRCLSPRQSQILERLLGGSRDCEIGIELGISVSTVKAHVRALLPVLGLRSRRELHGRHDLLNPPPL